MFTCKKIRNGSTYLSTHLSANDYYCEKERVSGVWVGKGAERLGIAGQTIEKALAPKTKANIRNLMHLLYECSRR